MLYFLGFGCKNIHYCRFFTIFANPNQYFIMTQPIEEKNPAPERKTKLFSYIDSKDYYAHMTENDIPRAVSRGGIFLCLEGEGDVIINQNKYRLNKCTMCVAFPGTIIQAFNASEGFKSYTLAIDIDFLRELSFPSSNSIQMLMRENPCIQLTQEQLDTIMELCTMMHAKDSRSDHPYHEQINHHMLLLLCYELAGIYAKNIPVEHEPCTRQDLLFRQFLQLLSTDMTISREVQYYADKVDITPKYLTLISRQTSGRSAAQWITYTVILNAKALLATSQLTIQQVSTKLNFPNPSFFGQYFLRHTGMTPKEYRRSKQ